MPQSSKPLSASPFAFSQSTLDCVVGGRSALDLSRLDIFTREQARDFVQTYGYNLDDPTQLADLWATHGRALALIREQLLDEGEEVPPELFDPTKLEDITDLLIHASRKEPQTIHLQKWACALLKVMHVYVHLRNDLFSAFRDEIQQQILKPLEACITTEDGKTFVSASERIEIERLEVKPFKTTASSVIKLLARPERVALTLLDKLGVRFVTKNIFDSFRVVRFLVESNIVSFPHIIPDQSSNTLFPLNLFMESMEELEHSQAGAGAISDAVIEEWLKRSFEAHASRAEFKEKLNQFSGPDHRFIKFINRKLIAVPIGTGSKEKSFRFFYPFEIQIMDEATWQKNLTGPTAHDQYKERQRRRARERVLGLSNEAL